MIPIISDTFSSILSHPILTSLTLLLSHHLMTTFISYRRLSHIPGPLLAALTRLYIITLSTSGHIGSTFTSLGKHYGPLVRIGPNYLATSDPALLRRMGAVRGTYDKDDWYVAFRWQPYEESTFTFRGRQEHDRARARVTSAYATKGRETDLAEGLVDEQIVALVDLLRRKYAHPGLDAGGEKGEGKGTKPLVDWADLSSYLTMDVVTRAALGKAFGNVKEDKDVTGFLTEVRDGWWFVALFNEWPLLRNLLFSRTFLSWFGPKPEDKNGRGVIMAGVSHAIRDRFQKPDTGEHKDMLASWMQHGLTQPECESEALLALVAGSETTASVLRCSMLHLLSAPSVYTKLKGIVKQCVQDGTVSEPISIAQAQEIPYLRAVIYENLRMRPGTTALFPKVVPPEGDTVCGKYIPGGTVVAMNISALLRDETIFGADADMYRPERWMECPDAQSRLAMEREVELMFGSGRWQCLGKPIALMELYKTVFELLRNFDLQIATPGTPWRSVNYAVYVEQDQLIKVHEAPV